MENNEIYSAEIKLNAKQAQNELKKLQEQQQRLRNAQKELVKNKGSKEAIQSLQKEIDKCSNSIRNQQKYINGLNHSVKDLATASYNELRNTVKALTRELQNGKIEKHSKEWEMVTARIREAKTRMKEFQDATKPQEGIFSRMIHSMNKNWGAIVQVGAALTGLTMTIRKSVDAYASMDQEMANVRKYTGQTTEEVEELNEEFKKMDTRTPREKLNQLAGAAGRLGLQTNEAVKEFVEAADTINLALGDDLGDKAVDTIGKLAIAFGDDKEKGLKGAMLATGSALNEIVQNSPAAAEPVIDFTEKLSGVGQQAHMTQAQIMGLGSALDQNNQEMATASTVMSQLITKMYQDPARFAKMAGMNVREFTEIIKRDMNEGLIKWLQHVNSLGDMSVLAGKFDELKMDGTRAVGVLATLAGHIDQVTEAQKLATNAFAEGTSVIKEAEVQNNTVQAELEKAKKGFIEMSIALGKELLPVVKYTTTGVTMTTKALAAIVPFIKENIGLIVKLAIVIAAYNTQLLVSVTRTKAKIFWEKASLALTKSRTIALNALYSVTLLYDIAVAKLTGNVRKLAMAQALLNDISKRNPYGIALAAVAALGVAIHSYFRYHSEAEEQLRNKQKKNHQDRMREIKEMERQVNSSIAGEKARIDSLNKKIHDNKLSVDDRKKAIKEIQAIIPNYHASISAEGKLYNENVRVISTYISTLKDAARAEAAYSKMVKLEGNKLDVEEQSRRKKNNRAADIRAAQRYGFNPQTEKIVKGSGSVGDIGYFRENISTGQRTFFANINSQKGSQAYAVSQRFAINDSAVKDLDKTLEETNKNIDSLNKVVETSNKNIEKGNKITGSNVSANLGLKSGAISANGGGGSSEGSGSDVNKKETDALKAAAEKAKSEYQANVANEMISYRQGLTSYIEYIDKKHQLTQEYYDKLKEIYGEDSNEYKQALLKRESEESEYYAWQLKQKGGDLEAQRRERDIAIQRQFYDRNNKETYMNQEVLNENLFRSELKFLKDKADLYKKGSKERIEAEEQLNIREKEHQLELENNYMKKLQEYRSMLTNGNIEAMKEVALKNVELLYEQLQKTGEMTKEEYDEIVRHIKADFAAQSAENASNNNLRNRGAAALDNAKKRAGIQDSPNPDGIVTGIAGIFSSVKQHKAINEELERLYQEDAISYEELQEAKKQAAMEAGEQSRRAWAASISSISDMIGAASSYAQACSDAEVAKVTANYDKQIEAAGNNTKKREKLEKKKQEEINSIKNAANKRAMKMEIAQATAQTAISAINAYSSAAAVPLIGYILAPIAAGAAIAAGMLQIATIKKQHEAEAAGYYEGGFTGGNNYRKEAGVVHEGEFVANHDAVNNTQLQPVFSLLDNAQRNNRVASLTQRDVAEVIGSPGTTPVVVNTDNSAIKEELKATQMVIRMLHNRLQYPIECRMSTKDFHDDYEYYLTLLNNKK